MALGYLRREYPSRMEKNISSLLVPYLPNTGHWLPAFVRVDRVHLIDMPMGREMVKLMMSLGLLGPQVLRKSLANTVWKDPSSCRENEPRT